MQNKKYAFESAGTHNLENNIQQMIDRYSNGTTYLAILEAAASANYAGVIQAMAEQNVVGDIANAWNLINVYESRAADENLDTMTIYLYVTMEYEQCECTIISYWSQREAEKRYGPYTGMPNARARQRYLQEAEQDVARECDE